MTEEGSLPDFDSTFLKALDEEITGLFSADVTKSLYASLYKSYGITREQVPSQIDKLQTTFQKVFGRSGVVIERHIAKRLFTALGIQFVPGSNSTLLDYVGKARESVGIVRSEAQDTPLRLTSLSKSTPA